MKKCFILLLIIISISVYARSNEEYQVYRITGDSITLKSKWKEAIASAEKADKDFWIGYSITRLESKNTTFCSHRNDQGGKSLEEILYGTKTSKESAEDALNEFEKEDEDTLKELVILFRYDQSQDLESIDFSDLYDYVDFDNYPLYWLGNMSNHQESMKFLKELYSENNSVQLKEETVSLIGLHQVQPDVSEFLRSVIQSDDEYKVRENAVFWLGIQNNNSDAEFLKELVDHDQSMKIREKAVFAIGLVKSDIAIDYLIDIARNSESNKLRKEAIFWLGQKASEKSSSELENIVYNEEDMELKEQAVFALSQLSNDDGVTTLIDIAQNHPSTGIRKKAIFWLGQSGDPRALDAIISFLDNN